MDWIQWWPETIVWPPHLAGSDVLQSQAYQLAFHYAYLNAQLLLVALALGAGVVSCLLRYSQHRHPSTPLPDVPLGSLISLSMAMGFSLMALILFVLALSHLLLYTTVQWVFLVGSLAGGVAIVSQRQFWGVAASRVGWRDVCVVLPFLALLVVCQVSSIDSVSLGDATSYHLPMAANMLAAGGVVVDESLIYPWHSLNINLFYTLALMQDMDALRAQNLHALFATLMMLGIFQFLRELRVPFFLAVAIPFVFTEIYTVKYSKISAAVDLGAAFFVFNCIFALWYWRKWQSPWLLVVSAACLGSAMGSKYLMALFSFPVAIYIWRVMGKAFFKPLCVYATWAALFGLGWYIYNWTQTGNPVHPFAPGVFGYYLWDETDIRHQMAAVANEWIPRNAWGLFFAPYFASQHVPLWVQGPFFVLCLLYASAVLSLFIRARGRMLLLFCLVHTVSWIWGSQDPRHFIPVMPFVLVYTGSMLAEISRRLFCLLAPAWAGKVAVRYAGAFVSVLALVAVFSYAGAKVRNEFVTLYYRNYVPGPKNDKMMRNNPVFDLIYMANQMFGKDEAVFEFYWRDGRWFYQNRDNLYGSQFGREGYRQVMKRAMGDDGASGKKGLTQLQDALRKEYGAVGMLFPIQLLDRRFDFNETDLHEQCESIYQNTEGLICRFREAQSGRATP